MYALEKFVCLVHIFPMQALESFTTHPAKGDNILARILRPPQITNSFVKLCILIPHMKTTFPSFTDRPQTHTCRQEIITTKQQTSKQKFLQSKLF